MCTICNKFVINIKTKNLSQYEVTFAYKVTKKRSKTTISRLKSRSRKTWYTADAFLGNFLHNRCDCAANNRHQPNG